ncbi:MULTISPECIES: hypothetical protein [unclassified Burkholderia]|uniref:hypothetical protein n=1 Tax=unclassified Burkholderia TaxID=2613784 RepID=UPI002ABDF505|nr:MULTISPECIES: hypothetical protein [unclassified Burkholderia]
MTRTLLRALIAISSWFAFETNTDDSRSNVSLPSGFEYSTGAHQRGVTDGCLNRREQAAFGLCPDYASQGVALVRPRRRTVVSGCGGTAPRVPAPGIRRAFHRAPQKSLDYLSTSR